MNKSFLFRKKLDDERVIRLIGAHNGLSARLGENAGFDAVWASGFELSSAFCVPDANILSMTECLQATDIINRSVNIPVIADCDSGFGDINNIIHLVGLYESRGVAGICIEDKHFPKINSFINSKQDLVSIENFSEKLMAANSAKKDKSFFVIARIEALIAGVGMHEALKRGYAYEEAGADALLIHSKLNEATEIFEFSRKFKGKIPLFVVPTTYWNMKISEIYNTNIKVVIYANHGIRATVTAMKKTFESIIANGSSAYVEKEIAPIKELFKLQGMDIHNKNYELYSLQARDLSRNFQEEN